MERAARKCGRIGQHAWLARATLRFIYWSAFALYVMNVDSLDGKGRLWNWVLEFGCFVAGFLHFAWIFVHRKHIQESLKSGRIEPSGDG
jgi:hypothetical protein